MIYGIFSDIHSNLEAFQKVLDFYKSFGVDKYVCVGDVVGYGPDPNNCVEIIKCFDGLICVAGNHDYAVIGRKDIKWFNEYAQKAIRWTEQKISSENKKFLDLPQTYKNNKFIVVHGSLKEPIDEYLMSVEQAVTNFNLMDRKICFVAHTHTPVFFALKQHNISHGYLPENSELDLREFQKVIVNVGSVGQPRDGDPRACCAIYDDNKEIVKIFRFSYDIQTVQRKMMNENLPYFLIERLSFGI